MRSGGKNCLFPARSGEFPSAESLLINGLNTSIAMIGRTGQEPSHAGAVAGTVDNPDILSPEKR